MFIDIFKNTGKSYLRLAKSVRTRNAEGKQIHTKVIVCNIGPLDKFDDGQPNYLQRLRESFSAGVPLIKSLEEYCQKKSIEKYNFSITKGSPNCVGETKLFSHLFLERILEEIGFRDFFYVNKRNTKIKYDLYGFAELLIMGRLLNPDSKIATVRQNDNYYNPILTDYNSDNVYDTLDFIAKNKDKITRKINSTLIKKLNRKTDIIYYDVTNFYFEIEESDDDEVDESGNLLKKGLRKNGVSKEERKQPIVQMGLFMDDTGIPMAIEEFPGNTLDHLTVRTSLQKNIDCLDLARFIMIGDRGICCYPNLLQLLDAGNGYIVAKSLLKSTEADRKWSYSDEGFIKESTDFKYKSRIVDRIVFDKNGIKRTISEKEIVYWSKNFEKRSMAENKSFLEFLDKLLDSPGNFRITALQSKSLRKFLKKEFMNEKTGELINASEFKGFLDEDKIEAFKKGMGYYKIVTSELSMDPKEAIDKYHGLSKIEEQFRIMKGDLNTRPIFVRNPEHIKAHLFICFLALVILRIIQNKITNSGLVSPSKNKKVNWSTGLSGKRIQAALNSWLIEKTPNLLYKFFNLYNPDLKLILDAFNIKIPLQLFSKLELKNLKTSIKIFDD